MAIITSFGVLIRATNTPKSDKINRIYINLICLLGPRRSAAVAQAVRHPIFAYTGRPVERNVLAGFVADDHELGRMPADNEIETNPTYDFSICYRHRELSKPLLFNRVTQFRVHTAMHEKMIATIERMRAAARELEHMAAEHELHQNANMSALLNECVISPTMPKAP